jgi:23S rRNA pseudouridine1911/1915/1917 synthase
VLVLAEDADFLWLVKPRTLPVFPPHRDASGDCLLARLLAERPEQRDLPAGPYAGGILHRLDGDTSGLVVAGRHQASVHAGRALFAAKALRKRYRFLTDRDVPWDRHAIATRIAHHPRNRTRMVWQRSASTAHRGRWYEAETILERLGRIGEQHEWRATITTGVTHQIRVHAAAVGLALAGDRKYGGSGPAPFALHHEGIDGWPGLAPTLPPEWSSR